jgi:hypothetical protein
VHLQLIMMIFVIVHVDGVRLIYGHQRAYFHPQMIYEYGELR